MGMNMFGLGGIGGILLLGLDIWAIISVLGSSASSGAKALWVLLIVLLLVYRGALGGQVPLYLSNGPTAASLAEITADLPEMRFIDLGAGIGSVLGPLARQRPQAHFTGVDGNVKIALPSVIVRSVCHVESTRSKR